VSDRCFSKEADDNSGKELIRLIEAGFGKNSAKGHVLSNDIVPDEIHMIQVKRQ